MASVEQAAAGLSILARSLLSLGMGRNGYVPPTSSSHPRRQHNPDYVAPRLQEHLAPLMECTNGVNTV